MRLMPLLAIASIVTGCTVDGTDDGPDNAVAPSTAAPAMQKCGPALGVSPAVSDAAVPDAVQAQGTNLTWEMVFSQPGLHFYTLVFPTANTGYALGGPDWYDGVLGTGPSYLVKTTHGGDSWVSSPIPNTTRFQRGLACKDENNCWIAGGSPKSQYTTNGGVSWNLFENHADWSGCLWSAGYTGNANTVLLGTTGYADEPGRRANFLRSTDGINFSAVIASAEFQQWDFSCPSPGHCFTAAKNSMYETTDDGVSWRRHLPPSALYYGISCTDDDTCWEAGEFGKIVFTNNAGSTWGSAVVHDLPGDRPRFWDVEMDANHHGFAVGCTNATAENDRCLGEGMLYRTDDGTTWSPIPAPAPAGEEPADLMDVHIVSANEIFVLDWAGRIWRGRSAPKGLPARECPAAP